MGTKENLKRKLLPVSRHAGALIKPIINQKQLKKPIKKNLIRNLKTKNQKP